MNDEELTALLRAQGEASDVSALSTRVLADFDALAARRTQGLPDRLTAFASNLADMIWPGAPVWKPAGVLALSLAIGLGVGAMLPGFGQTDDTAVAFGAPQDLDMGTYFK